MRAASDNVMFTTNLSHRKSVLIQRKTKSFSHTAAIDNTDVDIVQMLSVPILHDALLNYARLECRDESILCYDEIQKYKISSLHDRTQLVQQIRSNYIIEGATYRIKMSPSLLHSLDLKIVNSQDLSYGIFDDLEKDLLETIKDIYNGFSINNLPL